MYNVGFVPSMYVEATICDNREKRKRSAKHNYERLAYEFAENGNSEESFGVMLDDEIRKIRAVNRNDF